MIPQLLVNGLANAALIAPPAVALSMLFGILRFPNFAVGGYITVGVFAAYFVNVGLGQSLWIATAAAMVVTALLCWGCDALVFRPMQNHGAVTLLVVSIALTFVLEHVVRLFYGADVRGFDLPLSRPMNVGGVRIVIEQLYVGGLALASVILTHVLLRMTRLGKAMRATADNSPLAEVRGIRSGMIRATVSVYCGMLLGLSGVIAGLDLVIEPMVGWSLTIPIVAAAILGGIGSPYGAMLGALAVGLIEEFSYLVLPSTYKIGVGFMLITVLLLVRPHGLLGVPEVKK